MASVFLILWNVSHVVFWNRVSLAIMYALCIVCFRYTIFISKERIKYNWDTHKFYIQAVKQERTSFCMTTTLSHSSNKLITSWSCTQIWVSIVLVPSNCFEILTETVFHKILHVWVYVAFACLGFQKVTFP